MSENKIALAEKFDEESQAKPAFTNEADALKALLDAEEFIRDASNYQTIEIRRKGKQYLKFRIRAISEDEMKLCLKKATKYAKRKKPNDPLVVLDTDSVKYRSLKIYTATVPEDRALLWDNRKAIDKFDLIEEWEMIDKVLLPGEKDAISGKIDELCGYDSELDELAKN